jgi:hypothetical protein
LRCKSAEREEVRNDEVHAASKESSIDRAHEFPPHVDRANEGTLSYSFTLQADEEGAS